MANKIEAIRKENKVKKWIEDHEEQIVVFGGALTFGLICMAMYKYGYKVGKGPKIDEWLPAPIRDTDGNIGVAMLGVQDIGGFATIVDQKEFFYEKPEYAGNFAKTITEWVDEANSITTVEF